MKTRTCDKCNNKITGNYIKCCVSKMENNIQRLEYIGDLCIKCWAGLKKNEN